MVYVLYDGVTRKDIIAEEIPYSPIEQRDQRNIFRALLTDLNPGTKYYLSIRFKRSDEQFPQIRTFQFNSLPSYNLSMLISSNRLHVSHSIVATLDENVVVYNEKDY